MQASFLLGEVLLGVGMRREPAAGTFCLVVDSEQSGLDYVRLVLDVGSYLTRSGEYTGSPERIVDA